MPGHVDESSYFDVHIQFQISCHGKIFPQVCALLNDPMERFHHPWSLVAVILVSKHVFLLAQ